MKIVILGNYMPRRCGIATFTTNLANSILAANDNQGTKNEVFVVAMNDHDQVYEYPDIVKCTIRQQEAKDYSIAANLINDIDADVCIFQHEFGIFGGESGVYVLNLLQQLKMPIVTTLHTILQTPSYHEKHILKKIGQLSQKLVVMSHLAIDFLTAIYEIPLQKIEFIHHGVPDFSNIEATNTRFDYSGKKVLGTFGFLGRSKGIETVINALPKVIKKHPNVVYVVLGQTHPNVKKHSNEEYRDYLKDLAKSNNVADNVIFEDAFFKEEDIKSFLVESDIYITPYLNEAQITSGTICYAIGAGACIVSTPFWHAKELLAYNKGKTFPFGNSDALAETLCDLLDNPDSIDQIKAAAFNYGKELYWDKIGLRYIKVLSNTDNKPPTNLEEKPLTMPKFSMDHIKRLTDDMGIIEHANYSVPDYKEGYCLDDNSRALLLVLMAYEFGIDRNSLELSEVYLRYIKLMQMEDGFFHNDMSYEKKFLDEKGSEDSFGRTIWAMGYLIRLAPNDSHFQFAKDIFFKAYHHFEKITSIRAIASVIIGLCHFLKRYPDNEGIIHLTNLLTYKLLHQYKEESDKDWKWFEPVLCYDNAIIPLALWHAYDLIKDKEIYDVASKSTDFLDKETYKNNRISLVGNTWYYKGKKRPAHGQQPINAMAMTMMYNKAFEITKEKKYHERMLISFSWFTGNNDLLIPLYDEESKGCCDGLEPHCVNRNQGAESTISYLLSYLTVWNSQQNVLEDSQNVLAEDEIFTI
ncbi:glycosyltransferase family 4 protein [Flavivirga eckloniae]|uniref:Glycosyl transferase n=1 Tax=Flavivirga eckloniae TaxID=1803846 RepID=A0A2K9PTL4_9FLAO|nr:glycosyltransferase family 4 protein [Flavivirga eckloniae]AUP80406.1 glycosyl transferase [Flavivirga eckloniae]